MRNDLTQPLPSWTGRGWGTLALVVGSALEQRFLWFSPNSVAAALPNPLFYGHDARSFFLAFLLDLYEPAHVAIITSAQR